MKTRIGIVLLTVAAVTSAAPAEKIRIGVLGDSISKNRNAMGGKGWPLYLGKLMGAKYDVRTFSANGVDCLQVPSISIWRKSELPRLEKFRPHIALIMLAANSARRGVSQYAGRYHIDYRATIDRLRRIPTKPKVYCCRPIPVDRDNYGIQAKLLHGVFDPIIRKTAKKAGAPVIDTYTPLLNVPGITTDGVHPSVKGMQAIAIVVYKALLGKDPDPELVARLAEEWRNIEAKEKAAAERRMHEWNKRKYDARKWLVERAKTDPAVVELTPAIVRDIKGDGPDGAGNTMDDAWGFWFELAHKKGTFARLDLATRTMSERDRRRGRRKKIDGPIAGMLPNPKDSEGWIYHSDWNGKFEGAWGDVKDNQVILYPYVEKNSHCAVAVTYTVAVAGEYTVTGKVTDLQVHPQYKVHDGIIWIVEVATGGNAGREIARGGPIGDARGRLDSGEVRAEAFRVKQGECIRFVVHPNKWWGSDMTKVELKIERVTR
jgi:alpha-L-fucosidase 2